VRDAGLFESALARPENLAAYGSPDVADLAAAYGYGIARNHPFIDGNKRTAFVAVELFLLCNGYDLVADDASCVLTMLAVAAGTLDEAAFADWIRQHARPRSA
jgi:death-on-curing protein